MKINYTLVLVLIFITIVFNTYAGFINVRDFLSTIRYANVQIQKSISDQNSIRFINDSCIISIREHMVYKIPWVDNNNAPDTLLFNLEKALSKWTESDNGETVMKLTLFFHDSENKWILPQQCFINVHKPFGVNNNQEYNVRFTIQTSPEKRRSAHKNKTIQDNRSEVQAIKDKDSVNSFLNTETSSKKINSLDKQNEPHSNADLKTSITQGEPIKHDLNASKGKKTSMVSPETTVSAKKSMPDNHENNKKVIWPNNDNNDGNIVDIIVY